MLDHFRSHRQTCAGGLRVRISRFVAIAAGVTVALGAINAVAHAQGSDSTKRDTTAKRPPRTRADSAKADSLRLADSLRIRRAGERIRGEPRIPADQPSTPQQGAPQPRNPRLLPDISVVGDLIGDFTPKGSTQE